MAHPRAVYILVLAAAASGGCRSRPTTVPTRPWAVGEHCWWAVLRSDLPPDSVAAHFERAFTAAGLSDATWRHRGDTAWAHAGPTALGGEPAGARVESRAVAYWHGDSTHFRYYVDLASPPGGWAPTADTTKRSARRIGFCQDIAQRVGFRWSRPPDPTGEESLRLWTRMP